MRDTESGEVQTTKDGFDLVILATGYHRDPFKGILRDLQPLLLHSQEDKEAFHVQRNYRVVCQPGAVCRDAGLWLQGCCESTHGVSNLRHPLLGHPQANKSINFSAGVFRSVIAFCQFSLFVPMSFSTRYLPVRGLLVSELGSKREKEVGETMWQKTRKNIHSCIYVRYAVHILEGGSL